MTMEEQWMVDRAHLRRLMQQHPDWANRHYADAVGRSESWVKSGKNDCMGRM
jgi:hypothetical protein